MKSVAVVILSCCDYEAIEIALACHTAYATPRVPIYILQNCRGDYDSERSLEVARRYAMLFPETVRVIEDYAPAHAYRIIKAFLASPELQQYELICKLDDDVFPITPGWLDRLVATFRRAEAESGERLAYVEPLVNNNVWAFQPVMRAMGIEDRYFESIARVHFAGEGGEEAGPTRKRMIAADRIATDLGGTVWGYPYMARWLHEHTTLKPDDYIRATAGLGTAEVTPHERNSINCILFRRPLWEEVDIGGSDDEHMVRVHCSTNNKRIVADLSVPFVHVAYRTHREENRDIPEAIRRVYEPRLGHPFPVAIRQSRLLEIEGRMRFDVLRDRTERHHLHAAIEQRLQTAFQATSEQLHELRAALDGVKAELADMRALDRRRRRRRPLSRIKRAWRRLTSSQTQ